MKNLERFRREPKEIIKEVEIRSLLNNEKFWITLHEIKAEKNIMFLKVTKILKSNISTSKYYAYAFHHQALWVGGLVGWLLKGVLFVCLLWYN